MSRKVLITGVTGQDGHYLATRLRMDKVYGLVRRCSRDTSYRQVPDGVTVIPGDVTDPATAKIVADLAPDEIYNLAALSHVGDSFDCPATAVATNTIGCLNMLEAARACGARFYQASTSELFGNQPPPQDEETPFDPSSPYAVAKAGAYYMVRMYRNAYGMHASNGILFNHESPLRGDDFVTQKVCKGAVAIRKGQLDTLQLGNLDAMRDWGHADDFVNGMVRMVRADSPGDYVLATGVSRSVRELLDVAFGCAGIDDWRPYVCSVGNMMRPLDVQHLRGDASKAKRELGWEPRYTFEGMIKEMVNAASARS